jgi:hypothetical protein
MTDTATSTIVLKWAWVLFQLLVEQFDSVEEAVEASMNAEDDGQESTAWIEVIDASGSRVVSEEEMDAIVRPIREAETARIREETPPAARLMIAPPVPEETRPGSWGWYQTLEEAEAEADRLRPLLGDRVSVQRLRP